MLLLVFHAGGVRYGLEPSGIIEILPPAALRPVPRMGSEVAGLLNYRGRIVPVLDLTALVTGVPAQVRMSSRIVVVDFPAADGEYHPLGLLAERAIETIQYCEEDFQPAGIRVPEAPFFSDVLVCDDETVQKIEVRKLLPAELQERLFTVAEATA